jgi:hypothetical protein
MSTLREAALSFMDLFVVDNGDDRGLSIDGIDMVEMTHRFDELQSAMKAEISPDIMQKAEEAYTASLHDSMAGKPDYLNHIAGAILAERERCANIAEHYSQMSVHADWPDDARGAAYYACADIARDIRFIPIPKPAAESAPGDDIPW